MPIYVIDEIGKMEMFSSRFVQTVRSLVAHVGTTVLATIPIAKGRPIPLVEELRHSTNAKVMVVRDSGSGNCSSCTSYCRGFFLQL